MNEQSNQQAATDGAVSPSPAPNANHNGRTDLSKLDDPCSSAELAAVLGKSPKTLVDWCQEREFTHIPCFRLGNRWYHRRPELMRWLNGIEGGRIDFRRRPRSRNLRDASARNNH